MSNKNNLEEFSAGGIVARCENGIFYFAMILNKDNIWTFPKGHIEENEESETAAIREVSEEIGITDLKIVELLEKIEYWFVFNDQKIHKFVNYYLMATTETKLTPQLTEVGDAKWVEADAVLDIITYKEERSVITKALSILKS